MVVMSIIVTLATIGVVQYRQSVVFAKEAVLKDDLFKMKEAIDQYYADKNQYPATLEDLVSSGYLRAMPKDPFTEFGVDLGDRSRRTRSEQSDRCRRRLRREERVGRHRHGRHEVLRLVTDSSLFGSWMIW